MEAAFNGERLKKARIYRGMNVAELAEKSGCLRQTISMYENNKTKPIDLDTVHRLATVLKFPEKFFFEKNQKVDIGSTYFRALLTTNKKYRAEQIQKMEFLAEIFYFLQEYITFPSLVIPDCSNMTPEEAAAELRKCWNLGYKPIEDIIHVVEQHGILVTQFATNTDDIDAFSEYVSIADEGIYLIGYSSNKTSAARIHFDIAHELGHICLHEWSEDIEALDREDFKSREMEANAFASAFLLPENTFGADVKKAPLSLSYYIQLKRRWKVSIQAMIRRAYTLQIISFNDYQMLIRTLQRRGMRKSEPLDDTLLTAQPALLKTAIMLLLNENVFTPKEFVDELSFSYDLSLDPHEIEFLLDLPKGTLSPSSTIFFKDLKVKL